MELGCRMGAAREMKHCAGPYVDKERVPNISTVCDLSVTMSSFY